MLTIVMILLSEEQKFRCPTLHRIYPTSEVPKREVHPGQESDGGHAVPLC